MQIGGISDTVTLVGIGVTVIGTAITLLSIAYSRVKARIDRASHKPILEVEGYRWENDRLIVELSNTGNGVVEQLCLTTLARADNGAHRRYGISNVYLERTGSSRSRSLQPGDQSVEFAATSKVKTPAPMFWGDEWRSTRFSNAVRSMKDRGTEQLLYTHLIQGADAMGKRVTKRLEPTPSEINPQQFGRGNSLENPSPTLISNPTGPFVRHMNPTRRMKYRSKLYTRWFDFWGWIYPSRLVALIVPEGLRKRFGTYVSIRRRVICIDGVRRTNRAIIRRNMSHLWGRIKRSWPWHR